MECAICFEQITHAITKLSCKHTFHVKCIAVWANLKPTCPCCRRNLTPLEIYYSTKSDPLRPPPIDTSYTFPLEELEDIPRRFHQYVYNQRGNTHYSAWIDVNNAAIKIQRVWKGAAVRSMYAWIFTVARFPRHA